MNRDTSLRKIPEWKLLVLSTGEFPIEVKLSEDNRQGRKSRPGQMVRMVDLKVSRKHGAFDDLKGMEAVALAEKCKREATTHYGVAGPVFVRAVIEKGITGEVVRTRVSAFTETVLKKARAEKKVSGQIERVAGRLGIVAAAGELAIEFGIVPWPTGEATKAAKEALRLWVEGRGGGKPMEEAHAVTTVRKVIEAHGDSRFDNLDLPLVIASTYGDRERPHVRDRLGYRKGENENRRWLIFPEVWRKEVCSGLDPEFVAGVLKERGMLESDRDRTTKIMKVFGKNVRCYVVTPDIFEGED